jgi:hypothetical protein
MDDQFYKGEELTISAGSYNEVSDQAIRADALRSAVRTVTTDDIFRTYKVGWKVASDVLEVAIMYENYIKNGAE